MKKLAISICVGLIIFGLWYLFCAFITANFNSFAWHISETDLSGTSARFVFVFIGVISSVAASVLTFAVLENRE